MKDQARCCSPVLSMTVSSIHEDGGDRSPRVAADCLDPGQTDTRWIVASRESRPLLAYFGRNRDLIGHDTRAILFPLDRFVHFLPMDRHFGRELQFPGGLYPRISTTVILMLSPMKMLSSR